MKLSELTENDVIHIRTKKEAKGIAKLCTDGMKSKGGGMLSKMILDAYSAYKKHTLVRVKPLGEYAEDIDDFEPIDLKVIPASKFLKSMPTKIELQSAISKVGEELAYLREEVKLIKKNSEIKEFNANIEVDFENMKEGLPVKHTTEMGKWYKESEPSKALVFFNECNGMDNLGYGFDEFGDWADKLVLIDEVEWQPATDTEVFEALKAEAERRGFEQGVKVNRKGLEQSILDDEVEIGDLGSSDFKYFHDSDTFECGHYSIYIKGKWATIIDQPAAIDWSKAGQILQNIDYPEVFVINDGVPHILETFFGGTFVTGHPDLMCAGSYSTRIGRKHYKLYEGELTLSN